MDRWMYIIGVALAIAAAFKGSWTSNAIESTNARVRTDISESSSEFPYPMSLCHDHGLFEASVEDVQGWLSEGSLTSVQLVECALERIHQVDGNARTILEVNHKIMQEASHSDEERTHGIVRGPLHGIPILIKDNIAVFRTHSDDLQTTAGSLSLLGNVPPGDAHVVKRLREKGAIVLGKSGLSEWADMRSNYYSEGYSPRGGQVRNVYNLTQSPGGSSSGSGNAVSANIVLVSFGTETDGSIISPAGRAGVVGLKPTVGLTSRTGVIPESTHQDTVGPHGKTVRDVAYGLDGVFGVDPEDRATLAQVGKVPESYAQFVTNSSALRGAKFGLPWNRIWTAPSSQAYLPVLITLLEVLEQHGAEIYNNTEYLYWEDILSPVGWDWDYRGASGYPNESEYTVVKVDFYNNINNYLSTLRNTTIRTLEDIIAFDDNTVAEGGIPGTNPAFQSGQDGFLASEATKGIYDGTYWEALSYCRLTSHTYGIDYALNYTYIDSHTGEQKSVQLDALLQPSDDNGPGTNVPAQAGYPLLSLPIGLDPWGVPFGLTLVGTAWSEPVLFKYGSAIEDAIRQEVRKPGRRESGIVGRSPPRFYEPDADNIPIMEPYGAWIAGQS